MAELTIKQEKFCRHYVGPSEGNASAAYRAAYNTENCSASTINRKAKELIDNGKIAAMIGTLKAEYEAQEAITVEEISAALRRAIDGAAAAEQWGASSQAALGLAKLAGLLVEKREITGDSSADHLDAVATLAGVPKRQAADRDDDNVIELKQAACADSASKGS
jgi:hypothetical protein